MICVPTNLVDIQVHVCLGYYKACLMQVHDAYAICFTKNMHG